MMRLIPIAVQAQSWLRRSRGEFPGDRYPCSAFGTKPEDFAFARKGGRPGLTWMWPIDR